MTLNITTRSPAAAGADVTANVMCALAAILSDAHISYASKNDALSRSILTVAGLYSGEIERLRRRAIRRDAAKVVELSTLPAILQVGRRLVAARRAEG